MLKTLDITNFTCFPEAKLEFSPGLNVIVGENGTGKSHLLKLGFSIMEALRQSDRPLSSVKFSDKILSLLCGVFSVKTANDLVSFQKPKDSMSIYATWGGKGIFHCSPKKQNTNTNNDQLILDRWFDVSKYEYEAVKNSVFIPPKEILSVFYGFFGALSNRELDFDLTYYELAKDLMITPLKGEAAKGAERYLSMVNAAIGGEYTQKNEKFYFTKKLKNNSGFSMNAAMSAEGHRKIGMLAYLLKNGSLCEGASLFWDEPEANLNPKLLTNLAQILVDLSSVMQITIATHSLFLLRELDICLRQKIDLIHKAVFTGLHIHNDSSVSCIQSEKISEIGDITALDASLEQTDRFMAIRSL